MAPSDRASIDWFEECRAAIFFVIVQEPGLELASGFVAKHESGTRIIPAVT